jgi:hypothetical protein
LPGAVALGAGTVNDGSLLAGSATAARIVMASTKAARVIVVSVWPTVPVPADRREVEI